MYQRTYFVYIMANESRTIYTGVTNNLSRRMFEHQTKQNRKSFTDQYNINKLVYFEETESIYDAIAREKQIKGWRRQKKLDLINSFNPEWDDLFAD